jgi:hypothetical protein
MTTTAIVTKYGRWRYVTEEFLADVGVNGARQFSAGDLLAWCERHHLRPVEQVRTQLYNEERGDRRHIVLAEVRAAGIPPEQRHPVGWGARLRAFLGAP